MSLTSPLPLGQWCCSNLILLISNRVKCVFFSAFTSINESDGGLIDTLNARSTARRQYSGTELHYHFTHVSSLPNYPTKWRKCQNINVYQHREVMEMNSFSLCLTILTPILSLLCCIFSLFIFFFHLLFPLWRLIFLSVSLYCLFLLSCDLGSNLTYNIGVQQCTKFTV